MILALADIVTGMFGAAALGVVVILYLSQLEAAFRQDLFALRDELHEMGKCDGDFACESHAHLLRRINWSIRFAHRMTLLHLLGPFIAIVVAVRVYPSFRDELMESKVDIDPRYQALERRYNAAVGWYVIWRAWPLVIPAVAVALVMDNVPRTMGAVKGLTRDVAGRIAMMAGGLKPTDRAEFA